MTTMLAPSEDQKNPKNRTQTKMTLTKHKTFFVIPNDEKCCASTYELHFSTLSKFFPLKSKFPRDKNSFRINILFVPVCKENKNVCKDEKRAKGRKTTFGTTDETE